MWKYENDWLSFSYFHIFTFLTFVAFFCSLTEVQTFYICMELVDLLMKRATSNGQKN